MPKRKARRSLFTSDDARRKAARVELERYERLRTARERVAISRSQDTEERRDASRHTARRLAARVQLATEDERYERLRTTRERMAISRSQDTEERRYFRLRYDAVKRAGPTLWFSHCAQ